MDKHDAGQQSRNSCLNTWRAGCGGSRTSGSEGGPGKPTSRKADRAPRPDPYTVLFAKTSRVLAELAGGRADGSWEQRLRRLARIDLLILDDVALRPFSASQGDDFYAPVSERAGRGSFILTANRSPKDWYELFPNAVVAEGVLDRLINSSFHVHMEGKSYRPKRRPVALALHVHVEGGVDQPVEDPFGDHRVGEQLVPVLRRAVGREDEGTVPRSLTDELVEVVALGAREGAQGEVVEDQEVEAREAPQAALPAALGASSGELGKQAAGLGEEHRVAAPAGEVPERLG